MKIGTRIISNFLIIFAIILAFIFTLTGINATNIIKDQTRAYLAASNRARAEHVRTFIRDKEQTIVILAAASVYRDFLKEPATSDQYAVIKDKIDKRLQRTLTADSTIIETSIINLQGVTVASSDPSQLGGNESADEYFIEGLKGPFFKDVYRLTDGVLSFAVTAPVIDDNGQVLGVSLLRYDPKVLYSIVRSENGLGKTEESFLINRDKYFITPSLFWGSSVILTKKVETINAENCYNPAEVSYVTQYGYSGLKYTAADPQIVYAKDYRGIDIVGTHAYIPETGWCLITKVDKVQIVQNVNDVTKVNVLVGVAVLLVFLLVGYRVSRNISGPIEKLRKGAEMIRSGDEQYQVVIDSEDEIGDLSRSFASLVQSLKRAKGEVDKKVRVQTELIRDQNTDLEERQLAMLNVLDDIREEEKRTLNEKKKYESLLESIGDGLIATDESGKILFINKPAAELLGYPLESIQNKLLVDTVVLLNSDKKTIPPSKRPVEIVRRSLKRHRGDYYLAKKDGTVFPVSITITPVVIDGVLNGVIELFRDITQERQNQQDLQKFKQAVEGASDHIIITDPDGTIVYLNEAAERITGYNRESAIGQKAGTKNLWGGQMSRDFYKNFWHTIKDKKQVFTGIVKNKRKDGQMYEAAVDVSPILDKRGNIQFFVGIERDVSKELAIDRAKTEFVSLASHQLRTPLSAISWYTEMLLAGDAGKLTKNQKNFLNEVYHSNRRMVGLVNSLLNVSRLEMGTFMIEPEKSDIREIADSVIAELQPQIISKKQSFKKKYEGALASLMLDRKLIRMVIQNLLSNAIKYTPAKGRVTLTIGQDGKNLQLTVADTGIGIPKLQQPQIFKKLFRADNVRETDTEGTGLGLYVVKAIVSAAGGQVWFTSKENVGTTFYVSLPLAGMMKKEGTKSLT